MTSDPDGEIVNGSAPSDAASSGGYASTTDEKSKKYLASIRSSGEPILIGDFMAVLELVEQEQNVELLPPQSRDELLLTVNHLTAQNPGIEIDQSEFWDILAAAGPRMSGLQSSPTKRKTMSPYHSRRPVTPINSAIPMSTKTHSTRGSPLSPRRRLSSYGVGGMVLDHDMPSFSSQMSDDMFYTPTGKMDGNGLKTQKYEVFGGNFTPQYAVERSWSPRSGRSSLDGSSSGDSLSPRKATFPPDDYALEAVGGASESEEEEAIRYDRNRWKKKCSDLQDRLHETEKHHRQADDRVHELEYNLSEMQRELSTKKKESVDAKGRNNDLMTQIDTLEATVMSLKEQLSASKSACSELRTELDKHKDRAETLKDSNWGKDVELQKMSEKIEELEDSLQQTLEDKNSLEFEVGRLQEELSLSEEAMEALKVENADLRENNEKLRVTKEELERQHAPSRTPAKGFNKTLRSELDSAYGSEHGLDEHDNDGRFIQLQRQSSFSDRAAGFSDHHYNFDVTWPKPDFSDASVQANSDTQTSSSQTTSTLTTAEAQTEAEAGDCRVELVQQVQPVSTQTDETIAFWAQELAAASALRVKCEGLERALKERERQDQEVAEAVEAAVSLQTQNDLLREQILDVQRQVMETRRVLNERKHFDAETGRWIHDLKRSVRDTEDYVRGTHDSLDAEKDGQERLRERIGELESAIASQKDAVLESVGVGREIETSEVSVQTDDHLTLYELPTLTSDLDWNTHSPHPFDDDPPLFPT
ncbi:hypothetical protein HK097_002619, partial [Rhizophlyctis rosea]